MRGVALVIATASASLFVAGCSVDSRGFGGIDAGTGATPATGGASAGGGAPGAGGGPGTGGLPGSGGAHASGGMFGGGSGGKVGTGGKTGTGGKPGTGGIGGSVGGGPPGSGGIAGEGGFGGNSPGTGGAAGNPGLGGAGGQGGKTCAQLVDEYAKAVVEAGACSPNASAQCQEMVSRTLSYCNTCPQVPVNDATRPTALRSQWLAQGCSVATVCPAIACVLPTTPICRPTDSGAPGGMCDASSIVAN